VLKTETSQISQLVVKSARNSNSIGQGPTDSEKRAPVFKIISTKISHINFSFCHLQFAPNCAATYLRCGEKCGTVFKIF